MAQKLNYFLTRGCDLLLAPFAKLPPFWGIFFLSLITSLFVLVVYRAVSSPKKVKETKTRIKAHILAIRLYRDFWKTIVSSFFKSLFYTGKYFALNLGPLLLVLPLMFLLFVQMDVRYGMRPFRPGESFTVKAQFAGEIGAAEAAIGSSPQYKTAMNPVYIDSLREVDWKLRAGSVGRGAITVTIDGVPIAKDLVVGYDLSVLSNKKMAASSLAHFIYPAEKLLLPSAPLKSISIEYPARRVSFLGFKAHWRIWYLIRTMIFALALKKKFGVEF